MKSLAPFLLASALLCLGGSTARAGIGFGTGPYNYVDLSQPVRYAELDTVMMRNPHSPSSAAHAGYQQQIIPASPVGDGMYFAWNSTTLTLHGRGYQIEIVTVDNGVRTDPFVGCTAFPGDGVSWYYYADASPPYVRVTVDNASHVQSGPCDQRRNYTPAHSLTQYISPTENFVVTVDVSHNCITDMPASNYPNHDAEQWYFDYIVGWDYTEYWPLFIAPTYQNPALSPPGCALDVSWADDGFGNIYSYVDTYGW